MNVGEGVRQVVMGLKVGHLVVKKHLLVDHLLILCVSEPACYEM